MNDDIVPQLAEALGERYDLGAEIGRGGMGIVYRATDNRLQRDVAIKVLPPELSFRKEFRERFTREAQLAAGLNHPHIVPIYGVGEGKGLVWYEMALVDGESVRARVEREGSLTEAQTRRLIREVAWALGYAHARGIVHRDIKPDNILIERGTGRALVTDFGIAKIAESESETQPGMVLGSLMYMAPEQATGEDEIDGRADVYALGLSGIYMLAGRTPFEKATIVTVAARIATGATPDWNRVEQPVDPAFRNLLERCVAADPDDRWPDAEAILEALGPQALAPRPMPASIRRLVRDFMLIPTVGFLVLVIDIVAEDPGLGEFLGWLALALAVNFGITLKKFTERGFRWPDLREGLEIEIQRQAEELEATSALKDRFSALVYIATASAVAVGLLQGAIRADLLVGTDALGILAAIGVLLLGVAVSVPISWIQIKIYTFLGRLALKLMPSLPRPEAEGWWARFADRLLGRLFQPTGRHVETGRVLPTVHTGWSASDLRAARRSTRSIDELFAELPRTARPDARGAREIARRLTAVIERSRRERAQLDREHQDAVASLSAASKELAQHLDNLRMLVEQVASGDAPAAELRAAVGEISERLATDPEVVSDRPKKEAKRRWLAGVLLDSAVTGSAPYKEDTNMRDLAAELRAEWTRRGDPAGGMDDEEELPALAGKLTSLHASLALREQRGKRLDPTATASVTQCEVLLAELVELLQDTEDPGATREIASLVGRINGLHAEISAVLEADSARPD